MSQRRKSGRPRSPDASGRPGELRMNDVQRQNYRGNEAALAWRAEGGTARGDERAASFEAEKQGIGKAGASGDAHLAGRQADRVRSMADGCESFVVAGALCAPCAKRVHAIRLFNLLCFSLDTRRDSVLPA